MKLVSVYVAALAVAFGGHVTSVHAQQHHHIPTASAAVGNDGISSPTANSNIQLVATHVDDHEDEKARKVKVDVFAKKIKDALLEKGVMLEGGSRHLSSSDVLVAVVSSVKLLGDIIRSDADRQEKLTASVYTILGILGALKVVNEDQLIALLGHFNSKVNGGEMGGGRKLMKTARYGRQLQQLASGLPVFEIINPDPNTPPDLLWQTLSNVAFLILGGFTDQEILDQLTLLGFSNRVLVLVGSSVLGDSTPAITCPDASIVAGTVVEGGDCCSNADCMPCKLLCVSRLCI